MDTLKPEMSPEAEAQRIKALYALDILDTARDSRIDRIAELARDVFGVAVALVSLVDVERQWFKACVGEGIDVSETPREVAFCDYAIRRSDVLVVPDAMLDPRFRSNPLVTDGPRIRFYAGAPLRLSTGEAIGTLCLIDFTPKVLSEEQAGQLAKMAKIVVDEIELYRNSQQVRSLIDAQTRTAQLGAIIENSSAEIYLIDVGTGQVLEANAGARTNLGYSIEELRQLQPHQINPELTPELMESLTQELEASSTQSATYQSIHVRKDGSQYPTSVRLELEESGAEPVYVAFIQDLTEEQARQQEFEALADRNRAILDASLSGILSLEPVMNEAREIVDFMIASANPANEIYSGYRPEELIGKSFLETFPDVLLKEGLLERCFQAALSGTPDVFELEYAGERVSGWFKVSLVRTGDAGLTMSWNSIDKEKRYELALIRMHELSAATDLSDEVFIMSLFELAVDVLEVDACGHGRVREDGLEVVYNYGGASTVPGQVVPVDEAHFLVLGDPLDTVSVPDIEKAVARIGPTNLRRAAGAMICAPIRVNEKLYGALNFYARNPRTEDFSLADKSIVSIMARLVAHRFNLEAATRALHQSYDELQLIFDNVPVRIWRKDEKNTILRLNKSAAEYMGTTVENAEGRHLSEFMPGLADEIQVLDTQILEAGKASLGLLHEDGLNPGRWVSVDILPVAEANGGDQSILVLARDVTGRLQVQKELQDTVVELKQANDHLEQYNAVVSHDLKAPLRHMRMLSQLLEETIEEGNEGREYARLIAESAAKGQRLISALMEFSGVSRSHMQEAPVDLSDIVRDVESTLEADLKAAGARIVFDPSMPAFGDWDLLSRLLHNLIENSFKYRAPDRPLVIKVQHEFVDGAFVYAVADNGLGIDQCYADAVFEVFRRLPDTLESAQGEGVGLSICKRIVERHGGRMWLDTEQEEGACFRFTLRSGPDQKMIKV